MFKNIKRACIYVGSIIGAGFASGRELILFFYPSSYISLLFAATLLSLVYALFSFIKKESKFFNVILIISSIMTFICMIQSINNLEQEMSLWKGLSIISGVLVAIIAKFGLEKLKIINSTIVAIIVLLFVVMSIKAPFIKGNGVEIIGSIKYVGMNILIGCGVVEKNSNKKDIIKDCTCILLIFCILFFLVYKVAFLYPNEAMPLLSFAKKLHLEFIYAICMFGAIITTMFSSAHIIYENSKIYLNSNILTIMLCIISCLFTKPNYKVFSQYIYPILGYIGCIYLVYEIGLAIERILFLYNKADKFNREIHKRGHYAKKNC